LEDNRSYAREFGLRGNQATADFVPLVMNMPAVIATRLMPEITEAMRSTGTYSDTFLQSNYDCKRLR
jgi:hypothetical protein